jgi:hypothetical protein
MSRADAQAEPDSDFRPWEQPGAVRRDVAPHRGTLLWWLATISLACSAAGLLLLVPAGFGVLLGAVTFCMAERDMIRMGGGLLDPGGRPDAHVASTRAANAVGLGIVAPLLCICLWSSFLSALARFL